MSADHIVDPTDRQDGERESDLYALLVSTVDELAQRYRWNESG